MTGGADGFRRACVLVDGGSATARARKKWTCFCDSHNIVLLCCSPTGHCRSSPAPPAFRDATLPTAAPRARSFASARSLLSASALMAVSARLLVLALACALPVSHAFAPSRAVAGTWLGSARPARPLRSAAAEEDAVVAPAFDKYRAVTLKNFEEFLGGMMDKASSEAKKKVCVPSV